MTRGRLVIRGNEIVFLSPAPKPSSPLPASQLERPISEAEVYKLWHRAGIIVRASKRRSPTWASLGPILFSFALGVICGYWLAFTP